MQQDTWGADFTERVPRTILLVAQKIGGIVAGAFDGDRLVGFVFGMTGLKDGATVHWSDMLAVDPNARDQGIGRALKAFQRDAVRALGIGTMYWTYDPLVARNAHLNLNVLGADVAEYVPDMYGVTNSPMHDALGTDRFVVRWRLDGSRRPPGDVVGRVAIPPAIDAVLGQSVAEAAAWRARTRVAFEQAFADGLRVSGFRREGDDTYYTLGRA